VSTDMTSHWLLVHPDLTRGQSSLARITVGDYFYFVYTYDESTEEESVRHDSSTVHDALVVDPIVIALRDVGSEWLQELAK